MNEVFFPILSCVLELGSLLGAARLLYGKRKGKSQWKAGILKLLAAKSGLVCLSMLFWIVASAMGLIHYDNIDLARVICVIKAIRTAILCVLLAVAWYRGTEPPLAGFTNKDLIYLAVGELSMLTLLYTAIRFTSGRDGEPSLGLPLLLFALGSVVLTTVCIFLLRAAYRKRIVELRQEEAIRLLEAQKNYYTMLLAKEDETRAFRHDIRNHLTCMRALCDSGEYDKLNAYLDGLDQISPGRGKTTLSGNKLVDIINGDLQARFPRVELKIYGSFDARIAMAKMDIVTAFSNLLTNAFEAAERCGGGIVTLDIRSVGSNLLVNIQNPTAEAATPAMSPAVSTKKEPGHGYGLSNVRACLAGYNGELTVQQEGDRFQAIVVIPNVITTLQNDR